MSETFRARIRLDGLPTEGEWAFLRPDFCRHMMELAPVRAWVMEGRTDLHIEGPEEDVRKMVNAFREAAASQGGYSVDFLRAALS